ncbi:Acriflavin resistance protein [hydrothermal vent metagenome]|uniref:Acriflavin resistance protein n=1 Tax=hydrothermal vent metagenome TaxID=652676 RepID=A0A3B0R7I2_9ZZZZ
MNGIVAWWAQNKVAANLLMIALLLAGTISFFQIDREIDPYVEFPGAQVSVAWLGAGPKDIEEQITVRLEEAVSRVQGVNRLWSISQESMGMVIVLGEQDQDKDAFLARVKREVDSIPTFPAASEKVQIRPFRNTNEVMRIAVSGDVDERLLKRYADKVRRQVALLPHVPSAVLFGVRLEEVSIEVSEDVLRQYGITFSDVANAIRGTSVNISSGNVRTEVGDMQLRTRKLADTQEDFDNIIVKQTPGGATIRVRDVANVIDGFKDTNLLATMNGQRTVLVNIISGPDMDVVAMSKEVKDFMEKEKAQTPPGITLTLWQDTSEVFSDRIGTILWNFATGLLLVIATLFLFLRPAIALWVAIGIGTAFAGGLAFLPLNGVSFNMISTFAFLLVIGVIVDDAIIVGEAIHRENEHGRFGPKAAVSGTKMVIKPVIFAVLTTMIFFAPWMFLSGATREFTRAISLVVILALAFSLVESLLILPAHLGHLKPMKAEGRLAKFQENLAGSIVSFAHRYYRPFMAATVRHRYITASVFLAIGILSVGLMTTNTVKFTFMPETESDQVSITVELPVGTPYSRSLEVLAQIQQAEETLKEEVDASEGKLIENWYTRSRDNNILALVKLVGAEDRTMTAKATAERLRELIGEVPDAQKISVQYKDSNNDPPIQYVLNATDMDELTAAADDLMTRLRTYDGVFNVVNDSQAASEEVRFTLKPGAETLGITISDVARQVRQGFYGEAVQRLPRDGQDVRVFVRFPKKDRQSLDYLKNMRIRTRDGRELPLYSVADLSFEPGITRILRRERQRAIIVSAEVTVERIEEVRKDLDATFFPGFEERHPNVRRGSIGRAQGQAEFMSEILIMSLIAIGVAYILVAVAFRSYGEPLLILLAAIPFCYTGAVIGHLIFGMSMTLFSFMGLMAAAGVAVNDNLVLIDYVHRLRATGMGGARALVEAGVERFRPILLTSLTTFIGLMPLMLEKSIQAAFLIPVGLALAFGVFFALFVTLFLVPSLYAIGADIRRYFIYLWTGVPSHRFGESLDNFDPNEDVDAYIPEPAE